MTTNHNDHRGEINSLGNKGKNDFFITSKYDRLRILQQILTPLTTGEKPIMKSLARCSKYAIKDNIFGDQAENVSLNLHADGKVSCSGLIRCKLPECPVCSQHQNQERAHHVSKAIQECLCEGGEVKHIIVTKSPEVDTSLSKTQINNAFRKINKNLRNFNDRNGTEIGIYSTKETTFSTKKMYQHHKLGRLSNPIHYTHDHIHILLLITKKDCSHFLRLREDMKKWWRKSIAKDEGKTFNNSIGFRVDDIQGEKGIARYLAKTMSMEMTMGALKQGKKEGSGYGIGALLETMATLNKEQRQPYEVLIREHFKASFRKARRKSNQFFDKLALSFETRRLEAIKKYCENDETRVREAFFILGQDYENQIWEKSMLQPTPKKQEDIVAKLDIPSPIYNYVSEKGYSGLIQHIFREYHLNQKYIPEWYLLISIISNFQNNRDKKVAHRALDVWLCDIKSNGSLTWWYS